MSQLSPVSFHGDTIFCINHHNQPYTAMRPIVENMGLDWRGQQAKITSCNRWSVENISTVAQDGKERQTLCMPVRKLPAFLASINPKKVKPELRERIELYQAECDEVLWQYWTEGQASRASVHTSMDDTPITADQQCTLRQLVKNKIEALPEEQRTGRGLFPQIWSRFNNHFRIARYAQLPQSRMSEAIDYLMRLDMTPAIAHRPDTPLPAAKSTPKPVPVCTVTSKTLDALQTPPPPTVRLCDVDPATYAEGAQWFKDVEDTARRIEGLSKGMHIFAHGCSRSPKLDADKENLYRVMHENISLAVHNLEAVAFSLRAAFRIRNLTEFVTRR